MSIGLSLGELRTSFKDLVENGMRNADGKIQAMKRGEEPTLAKEAPDLLMPTYGMSDKEISVFVGIVADCILEVVDINNKAIARYLDPLSSNHF